MATSTGIAAQGMSAAIVYTAIDRITEYMMQAEDAMSDAIDSQINPALRGISRPSGTHSVYYAPSYSEARGALSGATLDGEALNIAPLPLFLDNVVGSFFANYMGAMDTLFPGLGAAGADVQAFIASALSSAVGVSYDELVDRADAETAHAMARKETSAKERAALAQAAAAGHRFADGATLEALARMRGDSIASSTDALSKTYTQRLEQERSEKMRLARAAMSQSMDRIKKIHQQVAELLRLKLQARGLWVADQNAVVDAVGNRYEMNAQWQGRITGLMREMATRRFNLDFDMAKARDRDDFLGKLKMANANEVVDLFGNMVTTLMNQVHAKAGYSGTERDVTDWDSILG